MLIVVLLVLKLLLALLALSFDILTELIGLDLHVSQLFAIVLLHLL